MNIIRWSVKILLLVLMIILIF